MYAVWPNKSTKHINCVQLPKVRHNNQKQDWALEIQKPQEILNYND